MNNEDNTQPTEQAGGIYLEVHGRAERACASGRNGEGRSWPFGWREAQGSTKACVCTFDGDWSLGCVAKEGAAIVSSILIP